MDKLPIELIFKILDSCDLKTFLSLKSTSKVLYNYCNLYKFKKNIYVPPHTNPNIVSKHTSNITINGNFIKNNKKAVFSSCNKLYLSMNNMNDYYKKQVEEMFYNVKSLFLNVSTISNLNFNNLIKLKLNQTDSPSSIDLSNLVNLQSLTLKYQHDSSLVLPIANNLIKLKITLTEYIQSFLMQLYYYDYSNSSYPIRKFKYPKLKKFNYTVLNTSFNEINNFRFEIFNDSPELVSLSLINCGISELNNSLCNLPLRFLDLSNNQLTDIPDYITDIITLKSLNIDSNPITDLSSVINKFNFLECLNIQNIELGDNFKIVPESKIEALLYYTLTINIAHINNICNLKNLTTLSITSAFLTEIPDGIYSLVNLTHLNLAQNNISSINKRFKNLNKLKKLNLSHNIFKYIISPIPLMKSLQELNMNYNKIRFINYMEIQNLKHIRSISIVGNRIRKITPEIKKYMII